MPVRPRPPAAALVPFLVVFHALAAQDAAVSRVREAVQREEVRAAVPRALEQKVSSTLFCFCLVMPFGNEVQLVAAQQKEGVGVFGCNEHLVFSNVSGTELFGDQASSMNTLVIDGPLRVPRGSGRNKAYLNTGIFLKVWKALFADGRFERYDWTLKVDVDTIVVPSLLRGLLLIHCEPEKCRPMYLRDSNNTMHGPMEVITRAGMKYFAKYEHACEKQVDYSDMNEAAFLSRCLDGLAIPAEQEPNLLLQVESAGGRKRCDNMHAAFHPFKSWDLSLQCLEQAGLRMFRQPPRMDPQTRGPSLFCFASTLPSSYETMLVAQQFLAGVGIFSCNDYMVFSNTSSKELFRTGFRPSRWPGIGPKVTVIEGSMTVPRSAVYFTPLNTGVFIKVWHKVFEDGLHLKADWTLKFDPDAVFLPGRLRELLWSACPSQSGACGSLYVENSGHFLRGPVEALSQKAVEDLSKGAHGCEQSIDYAQEGENRYITQCLRQLKIPSVRIPELLSDADPATLHKPECSVRHAVYHPFKLWDDYMGCIAVAGYILLEPAGKRDRWTLPTESEKKTASPSMFCWALIQHAGPEPQLLMKQLDAGVGIFSCDAHLAISNASLTTAFGARAAHLKTVVINAYLFTPLGGKYYTALNSPVFIKAWHAVFQDGRYRSHDWTLKLDADAVFVPDRVRRLLGNHCPEDQEHCGAKYLSNFGGDIHGPVEALSKAAVQRYEEQETRCKTEVDYSDKGEDWYLGLCMELLDIPGEEEPSLLSDWHIDRGYPSACDTMHATFHPFKKWDYYYRCLCESGFGTQSCTKMLEPTTTTTTVTSTRTSTTETATTRTTVTTTATTHTATTTTRTAGTVAAPGHRQGAVVVSDGRADRHGGGSGGASSRSRRSDLLQWIPSNFRSIGGGLPVIVAAVGLLIGAGVALVCTLVSRKIRARRIEAVIPTPLPTSPTQARSSGAEHTGLLGMGAEVVPLGEVSR